MTNTIKKGLTAVSVVMVALVGGASAAFAQTADPTNGAYGTAVSSVQSFVTDTAAGPLFILAAAVLGIIVGLRWVKRTQSAAT